MDLKIYFVGEPINRCDSVTNIPARLPCIEPFQAKNLLEKAPAVECLIEVAAGLLARGELMLEGENIDCGIYKGMGLARSYGQQRNRHR